MKVIKIIIILLLFTLSVCAQEQVMTEKKIVIDNFRGLNTKDNIFNLKPNELVRAHNADYSSRGSLKIAKGYDSISTISGQDSIISIYSAYYSDGNQQLFIVTDSAGVGYGNIYVTPLGSANLDSATQIATKWSIQNKPSFTQYKNDIYIVNGQSRSIIYDYETKSAREFPPRSPGEIIVTPLNTPGNVNGEFI